MSYSKKYYYCKTCGFYSERRGLFNSHLYANPFHKFGMVTNKTKLGEYGVFIKSHCEAPDYESYLNAPTKEVAVKMFTNNINTSLSQVDGGEWGEEEVAKNVFLSE